MEAMAAIGRALESLSDHAVQERVLRWATERYGTREEPVPVEKKSRNAALDLDDLNDLFDDEHERSREGLELLASKKPA
jgi:hypothetical protein